MSEIPAKADDFAPNRFGWPALAFLALLTAAAAQLRVYQIWESLWIDELHTAWSISDGLVSVAGRAAQGNQGPLYFWLAWASTAVFGMNELAIRLPSLIAGVALVPASAWAVHRWTGKPAAALLTGLLVAVDPFCLLFAQEARPYAVVQLVALLQVFAFSRLVAPPSVSNSPSTKTVPALRVVVVIGAVVLLYLHYTTALLLAAEAISYLALQVAYRGRVAYRLRAALLDALVAVVLVAPALPHIWAIGLHRQRWSRFIDRPTLLDLLTDFPLEVYLLLPLSLWAAVSIDRWISSQRPIYNRIDLRVLMVVACWLAVPASIAWVLSAADVARLFFPRYLMAAAVAPVVLAGLICSYCGGRWSRVLVALAVAAAAIHNSGIAQQFVSEGDFIVHSQEDWRSAVAHVNQHSDSPTSPVFVFSDLIEAEDVSLGDADLKRYCLLPVTSLYQVKGKGRLLIPLGNDVAATVAPQAADQIVASRGGWLIVRGNPRLAEQLSRSLQHALLAHGCLITDAPTVFSFGAVTVVRFEVQAS